MKSDTKWTVVWACWGSAFVVAEAIAIHSANPTAPLSHTLRRVFGVRRQPMHRRLGQVAFISGATWLFTHLWEESTT